MVSDYIQAERKILTEFLELYRDFPCLWSQQHPFYNNREAREKALDVLLEKYRILQDDANIDNVRKKIDNMRCAYKRERKKVLASLAVGGDVYQPTLWYYKMLMFIDDPFDDTATEINYSHIENHKSRRESEVGSEQDEYEYKEKSPEPPKIKKVKMEVSEEVFIPEPHEDMEGNLVSQSHRAIKLESDIHEAEAFGRTIGLQLKDLEPMQRFIAEKLISEVIFYGRLDKLNTQTNVSLNREY